VPAAPTGLTATPGNASVALTWAASSGAISYSVYSGATAGGESGAAIATGVTATNYSNSGLTNGTPYYYKVAAVNAGGTSALSAEASANPQSAQVIPSVHIDMPAPGTTVSGTVTLAGWAIDNASVVGTAISGVHVLVDGTAVGTATYGVSRPDVCAAYPGRAGCPNVGFSYSLNTAALTAGSHTITVTATDSASPPDTGSSTITVQK
jgi:cellulose 1,4-beta-cellobiosidase